MKVVNKPSNVDPVCPKDPAQFFQLIFGGQFLCPPFMAEVLNYPSKVDSVMW